MRIVLEGLIAAMVVALMAGTGRAADACCGTPIGAAVSGATNWVAQTKCPVDGKAVSSNLFVEAGGARMGVCSQACLEKVKAGPGAYLETMIQNGEQPQWVGPSEGAKKQETCPVMGGKADPKLRVKVAGTCVDVCCQGCVAELKGNPGKYVRKVVDGGESLGAACVACDGCKK